MEETANGLDVYDLQEDDQETEDIFPPTGDTWHLMVVRQTCLPPHLQDDKWLRTNIFCLLVPSRDEFALLLLIRVAVRT